VVARTNPTDLDLRLWWSLFRRRHQAVAQRCHYARRDTQTPIIAGPAAMIDLHSTVPELDDVRWDQIVELMPRLRRSRTQVPLEPRAIVAGILSRRPNRQLLAGSPGPLWPLEDDPCLLPSLETEGTLATHPRRPSHALGCDATLICHCSTSFWREMAKN
jgi:hypothetical protein